MNSETPWVLNRDIAYEMVEQLDDVIQQNLLHHALGLATMRFVRWDHMSEEEYDNQLPDAPFDLAFYIQLLQVFFADTDRLKRLLNGEQDSFFPDEI